jgi:hypothetical protein
MGFWQGLNEGLTYVMEDKARKKELEDARQERAAERQSNIDLEEKRSKRDREFQVEDRNAARKLTVDQTLAELYAKNNLYNTEAESIAHELSVLKGLGASPEVLDQAAGLGKTALQEAVQYAKDAQKGFAGTPLSFGPAGLDAFLSTAITTKSEGKTPNMAVAASMLGITPEDLDKEFSKGQTYRDVIAGAFTLKPTQETTFIGTDPAKPLTLTEIDAISTGAEKKLLDSLNQRTLTVARAAAELNSRASQEGNLSATDTALRDTYNQEIDQIRIAKEELDKGAVQSAINIVGAQALIPYFVNAPVAMQYEFGPAWSSAISRYTFNSQEELDAAVENGKVLVGDYVIVDGQAGMFRGQPR